MLIDTGLMLFAGASLALILVPGPDMIYVITRGISQGRTVGLLAAWGACSGLLLHTALAAVGLSALLAKSAAAFSVVKYAGAAYLLYLGIRALLSKKGFSSSPDKAKPPVRLRTAFIQGFASDVLNPKVALFFIAFLPQFVSPVAGTAASQMLLLGAVYTLLSVVIFSCIAFFSGAFGEWLLGKRGVAGLLRWVTGGVLIGLGLRLALPDRP
ncbi:LysE family translocator [soil metagenome]